MGGREGQGIVLAHRRWNHWPRLPRVVAFARVGARREQKSSIQSISQALNPGSPSFCCSPAMIGRLGEKERELLRKEVCSAPLAWAPCPPHPMLQVFLVDQRRQDTELRLKALQERHTRFLAAEARYSLQACVNLFFPNIPCPLSMQTYFFKSKRHFERFLLRFFERLLKFFFFLSSIHPRAVEGPSRHRIMSKIKKVGNTIF